MIEIFCANSLYCWNNKIIVTRTADKQSVNSYLLPGWTQLNCLDLLDHNLPIWSVLEPSVWWQLLEGSDLRDGPSHAGGRGGAGLERCLDRHVGRAGGDRAGGGGGGGAGVPGAVQDPRGGGEQGHPPTLVPGPPLVRYLRAGQTVQVFVLETTRVLRGAAGLGQSDLRSEDGH